MKRALLFLCCVFWLWFGATAQGETFVNPPVIPVSEFVAQTLAGDLRGNGIEDLVCITVVGIQYRYIVLRNDGHRHFTKSAAVNLPFLYSAKPMLIDMNGDGKLDLLFLGDVYGASGSIYLYFLAGNGDGTFAAPVQSQITLTHNPSFSFAAFMNIADVNGDHHPDIVVNLLGESNDAVICTGDGRGHFSAQTTLINVPGYVAGVQDLNNDGLADVVVYTLYSTFVTTYLNQGGGKYKKITAYKPGTDTGSYGIHTLKFADMDGDNIPDMVWEDNSFYLHLAKGQGDGTFVGTAPVNFPVSFNDGHFLVDIRDIDGDGILDVVAVGGESIYVLRGLGEFKFQVLNPAVAQSYSGQFPAIGDLDGDGHVDMAVSYTLGDAKSSGVLLLWGTEGGTLLPVDGYNADYPLSDGSEARFTQGSAPDIAVRPLPAAIPEVLKNNGDGTFRLLPDPNPVAPPPLYGYPDLYPYSQTVGDFNADGRPDLLEFGDYEHSSGGSTGSVPTTQTWTGNGDGTFQPAIPLPGYSSIGDYAVVAAGDLNHDGVTDISVVYMGGVDVLLGHKDGSWTKSQTFLNALINKFSFVRFADFDNDGILDVAILENAQALIFHGLGSGTFGEAPVSSFPLNTFLSVTDVLASDIDGDGNVDLLINNNNATLIPLYGKGNGTLSQGAKILFSTGSTQSSAGPMSVADVNRDGWPDIVIQTSGLRVLHGLGNRKWDVGPAYLNGIGTRPMVADLNQDGFPDIAMAGNRSPVVAVFLNQPGTGDLTGSLTLTPNLQPAGTNLTGVVVARPGIAGRALPTGSVDVTIDGIEAGSGTLSKGAVSIAFTGAGNLAPGRHWVVASYSGDGTYHAARFTTAHLVYTTTTTLIASLNPVMFGASTTLNAVVSSPNGVPSGMVQFLDGLQLLGSGTLSATGRATFSLSNLSVGTHVITASFAGQSNFPASTSKPLSLLVTKDATRTAFTASPNPAKAGSPVTLTATVTSASGGPAGMVVFHYANLSLPPVAVNANGRAQLVTTGLPAGTNSITAEFLGTDTFAGSVSNAVLERIDLVKTATVLSCAPATALVGTTVNCTAKVTSQTGPPDGSVKFTEGSTLLANVPLSGGVAVFTKSSFSAGSHAVDASFVETPMYASSHAVANVTIKIPVAATPAVTPKAGTYPTPQTITMTDATAGATIFYTVDGSIPTNSSRRYTGPIRITKTIEFKIMAIAKGYTQSAVTIADYTIHPAAAVQ